MLRPEFVERKLQLITDDLALLGAFRSLAYDAMMENPLQLATVERLLERVVMRAVDVNQHLGRALADGRAPRTTRLTYRDSFLDLARLGVLEPDLAADIARSASLRNVLAHDYNDADRRLVHASVALCLDQYPLYVAQVGRFVREAAP